MLYGPYHAGMRKGRGRPLRPRTSDETCSTGTRPESNRGRVTSTETAAIALQDRAALRRAGDVSASEVVDAACDALVAGLDTPGLRILTACARRRGGP